MTEHELIDRFRDYLDELHGDVILPDGRTASASRVQELVDRASFREMFLNFAEMLGIDTDELE